MFKIVKITVLIIGLVIIWSITGFAATPTPVTTPTISPTPWISATVTVTRTTTTTPTAIIVNRVRLDKNRINPMNGDHVQLLGIEPKHDKVTINIYTQEGYLVKKLWKKQTPQIGQVVTWDGKNESGSVVASGIYLFVINGKTLNKRLRIAVIK